MNGFPTFSRQHTRRAVLRGVLLLSLAACGKSGDAVATADTRGPRLPDGRDPAALVAALDSGTMVAMEQRTGSWQEADATSTWRAMATRGKVRVIDETMKTGDASTRRITHYFTEDGKPAAYYEFRIQTVMSSNRPPSQQFVMIKFEYKGDSVSRTEKSVDGGDQPVEAYELQNARKHAMTLLQAANTAPVQTPAKP